MMSVLASESVIGQVLRIVCSALGRSQDGSSLEVSGLLLGRELGGSLLIASAVTGKQVSTSLGSELDENFIASVAYQTAIGKIGERIVGMFHSHPGIGIFMSQRDVRTLMNFQRLYPNFLMMVIDPLTTERHRFFRYDPETGSARPVSVQVIPEKRGAVFGSVSREKNETEGR